MDISTIPCKGDHLDASHTSVLDLRNRESLPLNVVFFSSKSDGSAEVEVSGTDDVEALDICEGRGI
jgi:hypothetical protein